MCGIKIRNQQDLIIANVVRDLFIEHALHPLKRNSYHYASIELTIQPELGVIIHDSKADQRYNFHRANIQLI